MIAFIALCIIAANGLPRENLWYYKMNTTSLDWTGVPTIISSGGTNCPNANGKDYCWDVRGDTIQWTASGGPGLTNHHTFELMYSLSTTGVSSTKHCIMEWNNGVSFNDIFRTTGDDISPSQRNNQIFSFGNPSSLSIQLTSTGGGTHCFMNGFTVSGIPITSNPSASPTSDPSTSPTNNPSTTPTTSPTNNPSVSPTNDPSSATNDPSNTPTNQPSTPSTTPTTSPTSDPSTSPTNNPSTTPTTSPTNNPSVSPTMNPSLSPSVPTMSPTTNPTATTYWTNWINARDYFSGTGGGGSSTFSYGPRSGAYISGFKWESTYGGQMYIRYSGTTDWVESQYDPPDWMENEGVTATASTGQCFKGVQFSFIKIQTFFTGSNWYGMIKHARFQQTDGATKGKSFSPQARLDAEGPMDCIIAAQVRGLKPHSAFHLPEQMRVLFHRSYPFPTDMPSNAPTISTQFPTDMPTSSTKNPSEMPTRNPSTVAPTVSPIVPTTNPSDNPTNNPTGIPSYAPTANPTYVPTLKTDIPSYAPTLSPTKTPTLTPKRITSATNYTISIVFSGCEEDNEAHPCDINKTTITNQIDAIIVAYIDYNTQILSTEIIDNEVVIMLSIGMDEYNSLIGDRMSDRIENELEVTYGDNIDVSVKETNDRDEADDTAPTKENELWDAIVWVSIAAGTLVLIAIIVCCFCTARRKRVLIRAQSDQNMVRKELQENAKVVHNKDENIQQDSNQVQSMINNSSKIPLALFVTKREDQVLNEVDNIQQQDSMDSLYINKRKETTTTGQSGKVTQKRDGQVLNEIEGQVKSKTKVTQTTQGHTAKGTASKEDGDV